jgi:hypothetical protein
MRVKLPRGRSLEGPMIAGFEKERDRIDGMMSNRGAARVSSDDPGTFGQPGRGASAAAGFARQVSTR